MINIIFIMFAVYFIIKISRVVNTSVPILLNSYGFQNVSLLRKNNYYSFYMAQKVGDNYLIQVMEQGRDVTKGAISQFVDYATKNHYHNMILIAYSSQISDIVRKEIKNNGIQILDPAKKINSDETETSSSFVTKMPLDDNCPIDEPQDAIQDGTKANSIFGNLFGNKIDRL